MGSRLSNDFNTLCFTRSPITGSDTTSSSRPCSIVTRNASTKCERPTSRRDADRHSRCHPTHCGFFKKKYLGSMRGHDLSQRRFGKLLVLKRAGRAPNRERTWLCCCDCGRGVAVKSSKLLNGKRWYCSAEFHPGERAAALRRIVRPPSPLLGHKATHRSYVCMRRRCGPGGKYESFGIRVCERWRKSFWAFLEDMGDCPAGDYSIERIDTYGDYEPGNCRWATVGEQSLNKRSTRWVHWRGERRKLAELCRELGLDLKVVGPRLRLGWSLEKAFSAPVTPYNKHQR